MQLHFVKLVFDGTGQVKKYGIYYCIYHTS